MKTRILSVSIALAFFVLSCVATTPKASSRESGLLTPDPGFPENYFEDPYAIPIPLYVVEALAIEGVTHKSEHGLADSRSPLLSAVEPPALEDAIRKFQYDSPACYGPLLSAVEPSAIEDVIEKLHQDLPGSRGPLLSAVELSAIEDTARKSRIAN